MANTYLDIEDRIIEACHALYHEEKPNISQAARQFDVPYDRLRARYKGRVSRSERPVIGRKLDDAQEEALCNYLNTLDDLGVHPRLHTVTHSANSILRDSHDDPQTPPPTVGSTWTNRFLARKPEYHTLKQKPIDVLRKLAHDPVVIKGWFARLKTQIELTGILQEDVYNFDETGFNIGIGRPQWVITRDTKRRAWIPSDSNRLRITVGETVSADGVVLPPFIILPGIIIQDRWFENLEDEDIIGVSESGYNNDILMYEYIQHFNRQSEYRRKGAWRMLIFDGYGSHITKDVIDYCKWHKIVLFCLPPHTSHFLQPLDVVLFQPYKHWHGEIVDEATRDGCDNFSSVEFLASLHRIRDLTFKRSSIKAAWRQSGIFPWDPEVPLQRLRDVGLEGPTSPRAATPPRPAQDSVDNEDNWATPKKLMDLCTQAQAIQNTSKLSGKVKDRLARFAKGARIMAMEGNLSRGHLARSQVAQAARKRREQGSRRVLAKGGVLRAKDARAISWEKTPEEIKLGTKILGEQYPERLEAFMQKYYKALMVSLRGRGKIRPDLKPAMTKWGD